MTNIFLQNDLMLKEIVQTICEHYQVDAIYLYGSRAKGTALENSDWDIAILFSDFIKDILEQINRPQYLEAILQRELNLYDKISIVDLELVPPPLQYNIIHGKKLFDRGVLHVRKVEQSIYSKIEKDYDDPRFNLRATIVQ
jgi:predicted nucleotidyltransferase